MSRRSYAFAAPCSYTRNWPDGPFGPEGDPGARSAAVAAAVARDLRMARTAAEMSRGALAGRCGLTEQTLLNIENGRTWPDFTTLARLVDVLDVEVVIGSPMREHLP